jgi:hypothetical protein
MLRSRRTWSDRCDLISKRFFFETDMLFRLNTMRAAFSLCHGGLSYSKPCRVNTPNIGVDLGQIKPPNT